MGDWRQKEPHRETDLLLHVSWFSTGKGVFAGVSVPFDMAAKKVQE